MRRGNDPRVHGGLADGALSTGAWRDWQYGSRQLRPRGWYGERVLVWGPNSPEWVAAFFGCAQRGVVVVPLDVESTPDFVIRVGRQVGAKLLLVGGDMKDSVASGVAHGLGIPALSLEDLAATVERHSPTPYESVVVTEDDLLEIIYTSGTTAEPRGVVLAHRNFLANLARSKMRCRDIGWERMDPIPF